MTKANAAKTTSSSQPTAAAPALSTLPTTVTQNTARIPHIDLSLITTIQPHNPNAKKKKKKSKATAPLVTTSDSQVVQEPEHITLFKRKNKPPVALHAGGTAEVFTEGPVKFCHFGVAQLGVVKTGIAFYRAVLVCQGGFITGTGEQKLAEGVVERVLQDTPSPPEFNDDAKVLARKCVRDL
jgi:hypothetical protein